METKKKINVPEKKKAAVRVEGWDYIDEALHEARWRFNDGEYIRFDAADTQERDGHISKEAVDECIDSFIEEWRDFLEVVTDNKDGCKYIHRIKN